MSVDDLLSRGLKQEFLTADEGVFLFHNATTDQLMFVANELRKIKKDNSKKVTWIIDRNLNTTNVCIANCKFCNFFRVPGHAESYITDIETYKIKIEETIRYGGEQLLLQGGHHPDLGLSYYVNLFKQLKKLFPQIKLHALGPPEIAHITKLEKSKTSYLSLTKAFEITLSFSLVCISNGFGLYISSCSNSFSMKSELYCPFSLMKYFVFPITF